MTKITAPGIYQDFPTVEYFADPCPVPSLTQSVAKILLDRSPRHAWLAHPRLNPNYQHTEDTKFNIGNAAHSLLIGRGKDLVVIDADDWRTKDAKAARDDAHTAGKVAILAHQHETATAMVLSARGQLAAIPECAGAFLEGKGEAVVTWEEGGLWFRTMIDWLCDPTRIFDLKTTGESAAPHEVAARMANGNWAIQAAIQERGLDRLDPGNAGRRKHYFVCQETDDPYALTVVEMPESVLTLGRAQLERAIGIWRQCIKTNTWPAYPAALQRPSYPAWAEARVMERMVEP